MTQIRGREVQGATKRQRRASICEVGKVLLKEVVDIEAADRVAQVAGMSI